jgi:hypothetical protein
MIHRSSSNAPNLITLDAAMMEHRRCLLPAMGFHVANIMRQFGVDCVCNER